MKKILLSSALVTATLFGATYTEGESHTLIVNQNTINDVLDVPQITESKVVKADGSKVEQVQIQMSAAGQYVTTAGVSILNIPISYKLSDSMTMDITIPHLSVDTGAGVNSGLGDMAFGTTIQLKDAPKILGDNRVQIKYKTTSGDSSRGLGSGATNIMLSHKLNKMFTTASLSTAISYTQNSETVTNIKYGDAVSWAVGGKYYNIANQNVDLSAKFSYFHMANHVLNTGVGFGETLVTDIWLEASTSRYMGLPIAVGLKIPMDAEVSGVGIDTSTSVYVSIAGMF